MERLTEAEDLGRAVKARRRELGYTQRFVAEYAGVSASFLSDLENGKETIQLGKAMKIINLLGADLYLIRRGEI